MGRSWLCQCGPFGLKVFVFQLKEMFRSCKRLVLGPFNVFNQPKGRLSPCETDGLFENDMAGKYETSARIVSNCLDYLTGGVPWLATRPARPPNRRDPGRNNKGMVFLSQLIVLSNTLLCVRCKSRVVINMFPVTSVFVALCHQ